MDLKSSFEICKCNEFTSQQLTSMRSVIGKYSPLPYSEIQCNATARVDTLLTQRQATDHSWQD